MLEAGQKCPLASVQINDGSSCSVISYVTSKPHYANSYAY